MKVRGAVPTLESEGRFSFDALNMYLGKCIGDTLNMVFKAKIDTFIEPGSIGNSDVYPSAFRYLEKYAGSKVTFDSITIDWLKRYEKSMVEEGKSYTTISISIYIRCIRALFYDAKTIGVIKETQYSFGREKYEVLSGKERKLVLSLQQIKQIINFTDGFEATERYRDMWFFLICVMVSM